ncbi:MAG TPA: T9SS type A sorting domain-containing protein [Puia sp.]|nr:T9SS type A sorting domain-containing protein [Puia sp.]
MKSKRTLAPVLVLATLFYAHSKAAAQSCSSTAGANSAGSFSTITNSGALFSWSNPGNAQTLDGNYATAGTTLGIGATGYSDYLVIQNFGFSIPSTATICQIKVDVQRSASGLGIGASVSDRSVQLVQNGALYGNDLASGAAWPSSDGIATYGAALLATTWGGSWQPSDVNNPNFGVAISTRIKEGVVGLFMQGKINQVTVTIIYDPNSLLSITLGQFSARPANGNEHLLTWTASATTAGGNFIIQRSGNSRDWQDIATIPVAAASSIHSPSESSMSSYSYTDHAPLQGANYYRLHLVSADGRSTYSTIDEVTMENKMTASCWPNPCVQTIHVSSPQPVIRVTLKDLQGRTLYMRQAAAPASDWQIPADNLPPGIYFVQVGAQTLRVLKEKN